MTVHAVVVDTNVVVAAVLTGDVSSPPAVILDGMLCGRFTYLMSPALLAEYRAVLLRPAISSRHNLHTEEVDELLEELVAGAVWREPVNTLPAPDRNDDHLWALASSHPGTALVTGDQLLLKVAHPGFTLFSPRQFLANLNS